MLARAGVNERGDSRTVKWPTGQTRHRAARDEGSMGALTAYRRVLRNPALARLLIGEFVSSVGDWLYLVALLVVVYAESGDPVVLGIIGAARVLPMCCCPYQPASPPTVTTVA